VEKSETQSNINNNVSADNRLNKRCENIGPLTSFTRMTGYMIRLICDMKQRWSSELIKSILHYRR